MIHIWFGQKQWPACTMDESVTIADFGTTDGYWTTEGSADEKARVNCPACCAIIKRIDDGNTRREAEAAAAKEAWTKLEAEWAKLKTAGKRKEHYISDDDFMASGCAAREILGKKLTFIKLGNEYSITYDGRHWTESKHHLSQWVDDQSSRRAKPDWREGFKYRKRNDPTPRNVFGDTVEEIELVFHEQRAILAFIEEWERWLAL